MTADMPYLCAIRNRSFERDYFTGAYPEAYAGASTDVQLDIDIYGNPSDGTAIQFETTAGGAPTAGDTQMNASRAFQDSTGVALQFRGDTDIGADASLEILELRRAEALTRFLEAENRTGTERYDEWLKIMFGVQNPDFRDNYPRYIGGGRQAINVSEVINPGPVLTPSTDAVNTPQGYQTGHAVAAGGSDYSNFHATEHGILMTILSVVPRTAYSGGIEKFWNKTDRTEFFNPHFQNIGDQEILSKELGWDGTATGAGNEDVWAYAPRFAEYKHKLNIVCGEYQSSLDYWHMSRIHDNQDGAAIAFSGTFHQCIYSDDEMIRIFAAQGTEHHLYIQIYNDIKAILPMHVTDIPK